MPKLTVENQFLDLSDYGRPIAIQIAKSLQNTKVTAIHLTGCFLISGTVAIFCILQNQFILAGIFLILKCILDAADGELARAKNHPSYVGRYLDSIFDFILNAGILWAIFYVSNNTKTALFVAFIAMELQGSLYNYYYIIKRSKLSGSDKTSRIEETSSPIAFKGEDQKMVNRMYFIFNLMYAPFDKTIIYCDKTAQLRNSFPNWFMSLTSIYGLGFQLLIISFMLAFRINELIIPFFIAYSAAGVVMIGIRKTWLPYSSADF